MKNKELFLKNKIMETLITDILKPVGQKLIDADEMVNDRTIFDYIDEYSFLIYMEKIKNGYNILEE